MAKPAAIELPGGDEQGPLSQIISRVATGGERLVISQNGKAQVAVVPVEDLDRLAQFERNRERAIEVTEALRAAAAENGTDTLSDEEIDAEIAAARRERREKGASTGGR
jgi:prevent-host-death family protein